MHMLAVTPCWNVFSCKYGSSRGPICHSITDTMKRYCCTTPTTHFVQDQTYLTHMLAANGYKTNSPLLLHPLKMLCIQKCRWLVINTSNGSFVCVCVFCLGGGWSSVFQMAALIRLEMLNLSSLEPLKTRQVLSLLCVIAALEPLITKPNPSPLIPFIFTAIGLHYICSWHDIKPVSLIWTSHT